MNVLDDIRRLYYGATQKTIERDLARAVALLKTLPDEASRERAAVYMDGLSQMRSEWATGAQKPGSPTGSGAAKKTTPR